MQVRFKSKGRIVSFTAKKPRAAPSSSLTPQQRFMRKNMKKMMAKDGVDANTAMSCAAKKWKKG